MVVAMVIGIVVVAAVIVAVVIVAVIVVIAGAVFFDCLQCILEKTTIFVFILMNGFLGHFAHIARPHGSPLITHHP